MSDNAQPHGEGSIDHRRWAEVLASYERAELAYQPIRAVFERAERRFFSFAKERGSAPQAEIAQRQIEMDDARADDDRFGMVVYAAARAILGTPAPDLDSVIWKLELIRDLHLDEDAPSIILADLNRLRVRYAENGQP